MPLESKIEALTEALNRLAVVLSQATGAAPQTASTTVAAAPVAAPPTLPTFAAPAAPVPQQAAPEMPPLPSFAMPTAPAAPVVPFSDGKGLIEYVMGVYKTLDPDKGAQIQNVLTGLGYQNINDVKPEHYAALFQGVQALKGA